MLLVGVVPARTEGEVGISEAVAAALGVPEEPGRLLGPERVRRGPQERARPGPVREDLQNLASQSRPSGELAQEPPTPLLAWVVPLDECWRVGSTKSTCVAARRAWVRVHCHQASKS